jgi:hypothetical protein
LLFGDAELEAIRKADEAAGRKPLPPPEPPPYKPDAEKKRQEYLARKGIDDPMARCLLSGVPRITVRPLPFEIIQQPNRVVILYEVHHAFRFIPTDGRPHPDDMEPSYLGDSIGRWDGDTLVVDVVGFNTNTWLVGVGTHHSEKLRVTERYTRPDLGHLNVDVTFTDPDTFDKPLTFSTAMQLLTDTEMLEEVCESKMEFWTGSISDLRKSAVRVSEDVLKQYVGHYEGYWRANLRKVDVTLEGGTLHVTGLLLPESVELIPESDSVFTTTEGVSYAFVKDETGTVIRAEEIHRGGNYILNRKK